MAKIESLFDQLTELKKEICPKLSAKKDKIQKCYDYFVRLKTQSLSEITLEEERHKYKDVETICSNHTLHGRTDFVETEELSKSDNPVTNSYTDLSINRRKSTHKLVRNFAIPIYIRLHPRSLRYKM